MGIDWSEFVGKTESQVEQRLLESGKQIPDTWLDPNFRDSVTGSIGGAEIEAHMNGGVQAYESSLGKDALAVWSKRNIEGQGHPAVGAGFLNRLFGGGSKES